MSILVILFNMLADILNIWDLTFFVVDEGYGSILKLKSISNNLEIKELFNFFNLKKDVYSFNYYVYPFAEIINILNLFENIKINGGTEFNYVVFDYFDQILVNIVSILDLSNELAKSNIFSGKDPAFFYRHYLKFLPSGIKYNSYYDYFLFDTFSKFYNNFYFKNFENVTDKKTMFYFLERSLGFLNKPGYFSELLLNYSLFYHNMLSGFFFNLGELNSANYALKSILNDTLILNNYIKNDINNSFIYQNLVDFNRNKLGFLLLNNHTDYFFLNEFNRLYYHMNYEFAYFNLNMDHFYFSQISEYGLFDKNNRYVANPNIALVETIIKKREYFFMIDDLLKKKWYYATKNLYLENFNFQDQYLILLDKYVCLYPEYSGNKFINKTYFLYDRFIGKYLDGVDYSNILKEGHKYQFNKIFYEGNSKVERRYLFSNFLNSYIFINTEFLSCMDNFYARKFSDHYFMNRKNYGVFKTTLEEVPFYLNYYTDWALNKTQPTIIMERKQTMAFDLIRYLMHYTQNSNYKLYSDLEFSGDIYSLFRGAEYDYTIVSKLTEYNSYNFLNDALLQVFKDNFDLYLETLRITELPKHYSLKEWESIPLYERAYMVHQELSNNRFLARLERGLDPFLETRTFNLKEFQYLCRAFYREADEKFFNNLQIIFFDFFDVMSFFNNNYAFFQNGGSSRSISSIEKGLFFLYKNDDFIFYKTAIFYLKILLFEAFPTLLISSYNSSFREELNYLKEFFINSFVVYFDFYETSRYFIEDLFESTSTESQIVIKTYNSIKISKDWLSLSEPFFEELFLLNDDNDFTFDYMGFDENIDIPKYLKTKITISDIDMLEGLFFFDSREYDKTFAGQYFWFMNSEYSIDLLLDFECFNNKDFFVSLISDYEGRILDELIFRVFKDENIEEELEDTRFSLFSLEEFFYDEKDFFNLFEVYFNYFEGDFDFFEDDFDINHQFNISFQKSELSQFFDLSFSDENSSLDSKESKNENLNDRFFSPLDDNSSIKDSKKEVTYEEFYDLKTSNVVINDVTLVTNIQNSMLRVKQDFKNNFYSTQNVFTLNFFKEIFDIEQRFLPQFILAYSDRFILDTDIYSNSFFLSKKKSLEIDFIKNLVLGTYDEISENELNSLKNKFLKDNFNLEKYCSDNHIYIKKGRKNDLDLMEYLEVAIKQDMHLYLNFIKSLKEFCNFYNINKNTYNLDDFFWFFADFFTSGFDDKDTWFKEVQPFLDTVKIDVQRKIELDVQRKIELQINNIQENHNNNIQKNNNSFFNFLDKILNFCVQCYSKNSLFTDYCSLFNDYWLLDSQSEDNSAENVSNNKVINNLDNKVINNLDNKVINNLDNKVINNLDNKVINNLGNNSVSFQTFMVQSFGKENLFFKKINLNFNFSIFEFLNKHLICIKEDKFILNIEDIYYKKKVIKKTFIYNLFDSLFDVKFDNYLVNSKELFFIDELSVDTLNLKKKFELSIEGILNLKKDFENFDLFFSNEESSHKLSLLYHSNFYYEKDFVSDKSLYDILIDINVFLEKKPLIFFKEETLKFQDLEKNLIVSQKLNSNLLNSYLKKKEEDLIFFKEETLQFQDLEKNLIVSQKLHSDLLNLKKKEKEADAFILHMEKKMFIKKEIGQFNIQNKNLINNPINSVYPFYKSKFFIDNLNFHQIITVSSNDKINLNGLNLSHIYLYDIAGPFINKCSLKLSNLSDQAGVIFDFYGKIAQDLLLLKDIFGCVGMDNYVPIKKFSFSIDFFGKCIDNSLSLFNLISNTKLCLGGVYDLEKIKKVFSDLKKIFLLEKTFNSSSYFELSNTIKFLCDNFLFKYACILNLNDYFYNAGFKNYSKIELENILVKKNSIFYKCKDLEFNDNSLMHYVKKFSKYVHVQEKEGGVLDLDKEEKELSFVLYYNNNNIINKHIINKYKIINFMEKNNFYKEFYKRKHYDNNVIINKFINFMEKYNFYKEFYKRKYDNNNVINNKIINFMEKNNFYKEFYKRKDYNYNVINNKCINFIEKNNFYKKSNKEELIFSITNFTEMNNFYKEFNNNSKGYNYDFINKYNVNKDIIINFMEENNFYKKSNKEELIFSNKKKDIKKKIFLFDLKKIFFNQNISSYDSKSVIELIGSKDLLHYATFFTIKGIKMFTFKDINVFKDVLKESDLKIFSNFLKWFLYDDFLSLLDNFLFFLKDVHDKNQIRSLSYILEFNIFGCIRNLNIGSKNINYLLKELLPFINKNESYKQLFSNLFFKLVEIKIIFLKNLVFLGDKDVVIITKMVLDLENLKEPKFDISYISRFLQLDLNLEKNSFLEIVYHNFFKKNISFSYDFLKKGFFYLYNIYPVTLDEVVKKNTLQVIVEKEEKDIEFLNLIDGKITRFFSTSIKLLYVLNNLGYDLFVEPLVRLILDYYTEFTTKKSFPLDLFFLLKDLFSLFSFIDEESDIQLKLLENFYTSKKNEINLEKIQFLFTEYQYKFKLLKNYKEVKVNARYYIFKKENLNLLLNKMKGILPEFSKNLLDDRVTKFSLNLVKLKKEMCENLFENKYFFYVNLNIFKNNYSLLLNKLDILEKKIQFIKSIEKFDDKSELQIEIQDMLFNKRIDEYEKDLNSKLKDFFSNKSSSSDSDFKIIDDIMFIPELQVINFLLEIEEDSCLRREINYLQIIFNNDDNFLKSRKEIFVKLKKNYHLMEVSNEFLALPMISIKCNLFDTYFKYLTILNDCIRTNILYLFSCFEDKGQLDMANLKHKEILNHIILLNDYFINLLDSCKLPNSDTYTRSSFLKENISDKENLLKKNFLYRRDIFSFIKKNDCLIDNFIKHYKIITVSSQKQFNEEKIKSIFVNNYTEMSILEKEYDEKKKILEKEMVLLKRKK